MIDQESPSREPNDKPWLESNERSPIWLTLAALGVCAFLLCLVPFEFYWRLTYGELRLDLWWPIILAGISFFFLWVAYTRHRRTGPPQYFPFSAGFAVIACLCLIVKMIFVSASHWSLIESCLGLAVIAGACFCLSLALVAYAELWRKSCHFAVKGTVQRALDSGKLPAILEQEKNKKRWGSPHGLNLVHKLYQDRKQVLFSQAASKKDINVYLDRVVEAGVTVLAYLNVPWAPEVLGESPRNWLQQEIVREVLTVCLSINTKDSRPELERWKESLNDDPYHRFLLLCFELTATDNLSLDEVGVQLDSAKLLYSTADSDFQPPAGIEVDFRATMRNTWLAFAQYGIPSQAVFDFWMDQNDRNNSIPILLPRNTNQIEPDFAFREAKRFLAIHYKAWAGNNAPGWRDGLDARQEWNDLE